MRGVLILILIVSFVICFSTIISANQAVLRIGVQYDLSTLDPARIPMINDPQMQVAVLESLARYKVGTFEIEPGLATRWEPSSDGLTWRFFLRRGVQFHHGYGELKASDVAYTLNRTRSPEIKGGTMRQQLSAIKSIEAEDEYTVRFTFSRPDAVFLHRMAGPAGYIVSEKALKERGDDFGSNPVGTGPYMFDHWTTGQEVVLVPNPKYWGYKPRLDRVIYIPVSDAATMHNAFEAGDLDLMPVISPEKLKKYRKDPSIQVDSMPGLSVRHIGMNTSFKPFDDLRVRKAVAYAINRDDITEGLWQASSTPTTGFFPPSCVHALTGVWNPTYSPQMAKKLLAEAGYPNGFETTMYFTPIDRFKKPAIIVQEHLRAIGIKVKLEAREIGSFLGLLRGGKMPMFIMTKGLDPYLDRIINGQFMSEKFPGDNWTNFSDPDVDEWLKQAASTIDEDLRGKLFKKAQQRIIESYNFYMIDWENYHIAHPKKIKGFVPDPQRAIRLDNVYIAE